MREPDRTDSIDLPERLVARLEDRVRRTEFDSSAEYATYVLGTVLYHVENGSVDDVDGEPVDDPDEDVLRDRLEALGYLGE